MKRFLIAIVSILIVSGAMAQDQTVKDLQAEAGKDVKKDPR
jgi:hypothetical protein